MLGSLKEKIKSVLLVVLSMTMLSLVVSLWKLNLNTNTKEVNGADIFNNIEDVHDVVSCLKIQVNFGGGYRTSFFYDKNKMFEHLRMNVANAIRNSSEVEEISHEEYLENTKSKSIEFEMPTEMDAAIFTSLLYEKSVMLKKNFEFGRILFSENDPNAIYLKGKDLSYKVKSVVGDEFELMLLDYLEDLKKGKDLIYYQSISDRFLIPASNQDNMIDYVYIPRSKLPNVEVYALENTGSADFENPNINRIAVNTFDARMSFVREVRDFDDSLILMYGYGDRILKIGQNMDISYSESVGNFAGHENNLIDDLKLALLTIRKLGYNREDLKIYSVRRISSENQSGYEFKFFYRINGLPILDVNFKPYISARIVNSGVANISIKLAKPKGEVVDLMYFPQDMLSAQEQFFNILDNKENFNRFYEDYRKDMMSSEQSQERVQDQEEGIARGANNENLPKYQVVLGAIKNFYISYALNEDRLEPCFVINIADRYYVVDYYNYRIMN